jgi:malate dehydrogenase (oxaloacetate-decarboxylating)
MSRVPTVSYSLTVRLRIDNKPGMFARIATVIGEKGALLGAIDLVDVVRGQMIRDVTFACIDEKHAATVVQALRHIEGVHVVRSADRTFLTHLGGKIEVTPKHPVRTRDDLSLMYTPGVARVCEAIHQDPQAAFQYTMKRQMVAVVTDGTAVLGLGDIGPLAALPVMEGKAVLFKSFGDVDAFPICLDSRDVDEIVRTVQIIAPGFGGINLEDIAAPRCFEIEERLSEALDIPVFHDDQWGTAVVTLAGLTNALKIVEKRMSEVRVVMSGAGAAGTAIVSMLLDGGARDVTVCDRAGAIYAGRIEHMNPRKQRLAETTNPERRAGSLREVLVGADVFIGVSGRRMLTADDMRTMAGDAIVFAMANPEPEISPEDALPHVRVMATGRSDYPNQINNVLCFPGIFRGALDCRARRINTEMRIAAAHAIASVVTEPQLHEDYIVPSVFDRRVGDAVARAVARAAVASGVARQEPRTRR